MHWHNILIDKQEQKTTITKPLENIKNNRKMNSEHNHHTLSHLWRFVFESKVVLKQMSHCGERIHAVMLVKILHLKGNTEKTALCTVCTSSTDTEIKAHFKTKKDFNLHAVENPLDLEEHQMRLWHLGKVKENKPKNYTNISHIFF